jgi:hypothetical protein
VLNTSVAFRLLADNTRRYLLLELCGQRRVDVSGGLSLGGDPENTPVQTNHQENSERSPPRVQRTALHHNHLPKLQSHGMIEWDRDTQTVSRGEAFEEVEPILRLMSANSHALPTGLL